MLRNSTFERERERLREGEESLREGKNLRVSVKRRESFFQIQNEKEAERVTKREGE